MKTRNNFVALAAFTVATICCGPDSIAQDQKDPVVAPGPLINDLSVTHPLSPYITGTTFLVVKIDWSKIQVAPFMKLIQDLTGDRPNDETKLKNAIEQLENADASTMYFLADMDSVMQEKPLFYFVTKKPNQLLGSLDKILGVKSKALDHRIDGNGLLIGDQAHLARLDTQKGFQRDELLTPLRDGTLLDHTAVLLISRQTRSMLGAVWPDALAETFPADLSPNDLIVGTKRIVLTCKTPPQPELQIIVDTTDDNAAELVTKQFANLKTVFDEYLENVTVKRDRDQVTLEADARVIQTASRLSQQARSNVRQTQLIQTLRQLGIAFHVYHEKKNHLPPRCFVDRQGNPLHGWMVAILPYFEQLALYRSLKLDLPWDASENSRIRMTVPAGVGDSRLPVAHTTIRAPSFPGSLWHGSGPPKKLSDVTDLASNTIMLADAPVSASKHWAAPSEWKISETDPMKDFFGDRDSVRVLMVDGAVVLLERKTMDNEKLKAMLTIAGGD